MERLKKALAYVGLACMAGFLATTLMLIVRGADPQLFTVTLGFLTAFLVTGGGAVVIKRLQERAEKQQAEERKAEEDASHDEA